MSGHTKIESIFDRSIQGYPYKDADSPRVRGAGARIMFIMRINKGRILVSVARQENQENASLCDLNSLTPSSLMIVYFQCFTSFRVAYEYWKKSLFLV